MLSGRRCGRQGTVLAQQGGGALPVQIDDSLLRGGFRPLSPQACLCDFWAVSQEMGADFAMGPGLLGGCRRESFAVELADLGKCRRMVAFRAGSAYETAQKFAVHRWSSREAVGRAAAARRVGYIDGFPTGAHEASPRSCGVLMTRWMLGSFYGRFLAMMSGGVLLTSIWVSILVTIVRRNGGLTETLKGRRCRPRVSATFPLTPVR